MPDAAGKIRAEERARIDAWIKKYWKLGDFKCPICGSEQWLVGEHFIQMTPHYGGANLLGGPAYPHLMLISKECGYVVLINALTTGIIRAPEPAAAPAGGKTDG